MQCDHSRVRQSRMREDKYHRSCFEWLQLIVSISIPVAIAVYTVIENTRDTSIATANRAHDLDIADNEQKDLILQECQKVLSRIIEKYGTDFNESSPPSLVARFAILSALNRLDCGRRNFLVRLLYEAQLITYQSHPFRPPVILQSANLMDLNLTDQYTRRVLSKLSLENTVMIRADFHEMNIYGGRFQGAKLNDANFASTRNTQGFDSCDDESCLENNTLQLIFKSANLTSASFFSAVYSDAEFSYAIMNNANLSMFFCENCLFTDTSMNNVDLQHAAIRNSTFIFARIANANLYGSVFGTHVDFGYVHMRYVNAAHANFTQCQLVAVDLSYGILDHTSFIDNDFSGAVMYKVSLQYSRIINGNFTRAHLSYSNWRYAYCERCIFKQVDFSHADLSHAIFIESDFQTSTITENQLKQTASLERSRLPKRNISDSQ